MECMATWQSHRRLRCKMEVVQAHAKSSYSKSLVTTRKLRLLEINEFSLLITEMVWMHKITESKATVSLKAARLIKSSGRTRCRATNWIWGRSNPTSRCRLNNQQCMAKTVQSIRMGPKLGVTLLRSKIRSKGRQLLRQVRLLISTVQAYSSTMLSS